MRIITGIRGPEMEGVTQKEYERFLRNVKLFGKNQNLIKLLDNETPYENIESMNFSIINSSDIFGENPEIKNLRTQYPGFKILLVHKYLEINITFKVEHAEKAIYPYIAEQVIYRLSLILNLSYCTKIDFLSGLVFTHEKEYIGNTEVLLSSLDFAYQHSEAISWPIHTKGVPLKKTVDWFVNNDLSIEGVSKNKLHRAINAFSYLFSHVHEKDSSNLFWVVLGIEALLAEGTSNIVNQIKVKSMIILGEPNEYKKKLEKLYNYRSRLVHGDYDFPAKFSVDYEVFEEEYWDYLAFATSILLALIRKLIISQQSEFKFEYRWIK